MQTTNAKLDELDRAILKTLMADAKTPTPKWQNNLTSAQPPFTCASKR